MKARGDAREDSDIDLLLLLDKDFITLEDRMRLMEPLYEIELSTGVQINPFIVGPLHFTGLDARAALWRFHIEGSLLSCRILS